MLPLWRKNVDFRLHRRYAFELHVQVSPILFDPIVDRLTRHSHSVPRVFHVVKRLLDPSHAFLHGDDSGLQTVKAVWLSIGTG